MNLQNIELNGEVYPAGWLFNCTEAIFKINASKSFVGSILWEGVYILNKEHRDQRMGTKFKF